MELDPKYADVICKRYQELTGKPAVLAARGALYADLLRPAEANASEVDDGRCKGRVGVPQHWQYPMRAREI